MGNSKNSNIQSIDDFSEQETDAKVRAEGDGVALCGGDDSADHQPQEQSGQAAGAADEQGQRHQDSAAKNREEKRVSSDMKYFII